MCRRLVRLATVLTFVPASVFAQVFVVSPQAGAESSYRRTVLAWLPIAGATTYHLQVDDDPGFGSPEVDVVVDRPWYALAGETLRLNGQLSWAAYVRVNGSRWRAPSFTRSYIPRVTWPELAVDLDGRVHWSYLSAPFGESQAFIRTSNDWSAPLQLSPPDTDGNPHDLALDVDRFGIVHAFWTEQRFGRIGQPFYANSLTWTPSQIGETTGGVSDLSPSLLLTGSAIEIFEESFGPVTRFTSTDGVTFTRSTVPNSSHTVVPSAALDPSGHILLVEERLGKQLYLQTSRDNWESSQLIGTGRFPTIAVGGDGVAHVLARNDMTAVVSYSNSARGFATWTPLPIPPVIGQQQLPIVVDDRQDLLFVAAPAFDGARVCASTTAGEIWTCGRIGEMEANHPDLKLDGSGILHVAWADSNGGGYANSLGSFLAANLSPEAQFAAPVYSPPDIVIDTTVADRDGDAFGGLVAVGQTFDVRTVLGNGDELALLGDSLLNAGGSTLLAENSTLQFRVAGQGWRTSLFDGSVGAFPAQVEVRTIDRRLTDESFTIEAWNQGGVTINRRVFVPYVSRLFIGPWLPSLGLTFTPFGVLTLRVAASDGASVRVFDRTFMRSPGQNRLVLRR